MISLGVARVVGGDLEIFLLDKIRPFPAVVKFASQKTSLGV